jgi:hypothetical protein
MIARETKVGLLVASSFVCLVAIVLASKLMRGEDPPADTGGAPPSVAEIKPMSPLASPARIRAKETSPATGPAVSASTEEAPAKAHPADPLASARGTDRPTTDPAEKSTSAPGAGEGGHEAIVIPATAPAKPAETKQVEPAPVIVTAPVEPAPKVAEVAPQLAPVDPMKKSAANEKNAAEEKEGKESSEIAVKEAEPTPTRGASADPKEPSEKDKEIAKILKEQVEKRDKEQPDTSKEEGAEKTTDSRPIKGIVNGSAPEDKKAEKSVAAGEAKTRPMKEERDKGGALLVEQANPAAAAKSESEPAKTTVPVITSKDPAKLGTPITVPGPTAVKEAPEPLPVLGAPPVVGSRTVSVAPATGSGGPARAEGFDTEEHLVRQGETFASISQAHYKSDKYAVALLEFNKQYPLAARAVQHDPPEVGQKVVVPDLAYLEQHHGGLIPDYSPVKVGPPKVLNASPAKEESLPPAAIPDPSVVPVAGAKAPASGPTYQVRAADERLWNIARATLGDPSRWAEIYRLNPQIAPEQYIPVGTVLRLPAGAQVTR